MGFFYHKSYEFWVAEETDSTDQSNEKPKNYLIKHYNSVPSHTNAI